MFLVCFTPGEALPCFVKQTLCHHWAAKQRDVRTTAHNANAATAHTPRTACTMYHSTTTPRASALPCSSCAAALVRPVAAPRQRQGPALRRPRPVPVPRPAPLRPCPPRCHLQKRKAARAREPTSNTTPKPASTTTPPPRHHTPPHASAPPSRASAPHQRRCGLARPIVTCNRANAPPCAAAASPVLSPT